MEKDILNKIPSDRLKAEIKARVSEIVNFYLDEQFQLTKDEILAVLIDVAIEEAKA